MPEKPVRNDGEQRASLTAEQFDVLRRAGRQPQVACGTMLDLKDLPSLQSSDSPIQRQTYIRVNGRRQS